MLASRPSPPRRATPMRLLVVEDNAIERTLVARFLANAGYRVEPASARTGPGTLPALLLSVKPHSTHIDCDRPLQLSLNHLSGAEVGVDAGGAARAAASARRRAAGALVGSPFSTSSSTRTAIA